MSNEKRLLPCPFCGAPAKLEQVRADQLVFCSKCFIDKPSVQIWNTRAAQPAAVKGMPERRTAADYPGYIDSFAHEAGAIWNACHGAFTTWLSKAAQGLPEPLKLSDDVQEYLREGMESATGCEDNDVDFDFANGLEQLLHPLVRLDAVSPVVAQLRTENTWLKAINAELHKSDIAIAAKKEIDALRAEAEKERDRYMREVYGLNNEGDPIGGDPAGGLVNMLELVRTQRDTLRTANAELVGLLRDEQIRHSLTSLPLKLAFAKKRGLPDIADVHAWMSSVRRRIDALLASTGGGERG